MFKDKKEQERRLHDLTQRFFMLIDGCYKVNKQEIVKEDIVVNGGRHSKYTYTMVLPDNVQMLTEASRSYATIKVDSFYWFARITLCGIAINHLKETDLWETLLTKACTKLEKVKAEANKPMLVSGKVQELCEACSELGCEEIEIAPNESGRTLSGIAVKVYRFALLDYPNTVLVSKRWGGAEVWIEGIKLDRKTATGDYLTILEICERQLTDIFKDASKKREEIVQNVVYSLKVKDSERTRDRVLTKTCKCVMV